MWRYCPFSAWLLALLLTLVFFYAEHERQHSAGQSSVEVTGQARF